MDEPELDNREEVIVDLLNYIVNNKRKSMSKVTGVIEKVTERDTAYGKSYSLCLNGEWYSGFESPPCGEGCGIELTYVQKGQYKNIQKGSMKAVQVEATSASKTPAPQTIVPRDVSICYQSARRDGVSLLDVLLRAEIVSLPKAQKDKYGAVMALLDELTNKLYTDWETTYMNGGVQSNQEAPEPSNFE